MSYIKYHQKDTDHMIHDLKSESRGELHNVTENRYHAKE